MLVFNFARAAYVKSNGNNIGLWGLFRGDFSVNSINCVYNIMNSHRMEDPHSFVKAFVMVGEVVEKNTKMSFR